MRLFDQLEKLLSGYTLLLLEFFEVTPEVILRAQEVERRRVQPRTERLRGFRGFHC